MLGLLRRRWRGAGSAELGAVRLRGGMWPAERPRPVGLCAAPGEVRLCGVASGGMLVARGAVAAAAAGAAGAMRRVCGPALRAGGDQRSSGASAAGAAPPSIWPALPPRVWSTAVSGAGSESVSTSVAGISWLPASAAVGAPPLAPLASSPPCCSCSWELCRRSAASSRSDSTAISFWLTSRCSSAL